MRPARGHSGESGMVTVSAIAVVALIAIMAVAVAVMVDLSSTGQRAARAADNAALAASSASLAGLDPCSAARSVAKENQAELVACRMDADVATVTARSTSNSPWGRWGTERRARAAPLTYLK